MRRYGGRGDVAPAAGRLPAHHGHDMASWSAGEGAGGAEWGAPVVEGGGELGDTGLADEVDYRSHGARGARAQGEEQDA